ncbi:hypothetical protein [Cryptosporangium sp. NPDC051539]|uniref:hypothetical protein n=1 Tax=Cryptosporangium sp. NPDC051539 TaxID=3363962 RepID=UPI0037AF316C
MPAGGFRVELDDGQVVESDGSMVTDPQSGDQMPALVLRMTGARAHVLAHVLDDWSRVAFVFASLRSSAVTERALARTLDAGAALSGDPRAGRCALRISTAVTTEQRFAALAVLRQREQGLSELQRVAVVDSAARWLAEDAGEELAWALLQAVCSDKTTTTHVYLALVGSPDGGEQ